jgi:hypothetical protein
MALNNWAHYTVRAGLLVILILCCACFACVRPVRCVRAPACVLAALDRAHVRACTVAVQLVYTAQVPSIYLNGNLLGTGIKGYL